MPVLKRAGDAPVRSFPAPDRRSPAPSVEALALAEAEAEIARLHRRIADLTAAAARAERTAREQGRAEGSREALKADGDRTRALEGALRTAGQHWQDRLRDIDGLAAALARTALAKLFEPSEDLSDLTVRAIRRRIAALGAQSVITLTVSEADMPEGTQIDLPDGIALLRSPDLKSGECRFALRLGECAAGPLDQWPRLAHLLDGLSSSAA